MANKEEPKQPKRTIWGMAKEFAALLDRNDRIVNVGRDHELSLRIMKVGEEAGEAISARLIQLAQNPGKGKGDLRDVLDELADCISAASVAMYSLTEDLEFCDRVVKEKFGKAIEKKQAKLDELLQKRNRMLYGEDK